MFDSLNDEIRKQEPAEPMTSLFLRYAGVLTAAMVATWALYTGILYLE
jgi:hypothetical protein